MLANYVAARLKRCWSPEQITGRLQRDYPHNPRMQISPEAIYRTVYLNTARNVLPAQISQRLRRGHTIRHSRHHTTRGVRRSRIIDARPIAERPADADDRRVPGHWEGDLIMGTNVSQVATLVDRCTRMTDLVATSTRKAPGVRAELNARLSGPDAPVMKTLTWDRGMELAEHAAITRATGVDIYFADPRSPWQRGTNENTNGLLRQYLPKKTDLSQVSQADLDQIADELNHRPRRCLGFRTPIEAARGELH